jgi:CspA family cold shock protein
MAKIMVFIDGTWLYANQYLLSRHHGEEFRLDYGKLPRVLGKLVGSQLGETDSDIVRTFLFGSNARNYDPRDDYLVQARRDFFDTLKEAYHYEVEVFPIDYKGRRLRKSDRDPDDEFFPQEKCVDIALATTMLFYAAIPNAYDIAVAVIGDRDFVPLLQHVRRLGKRVAVASVQGSCAAEYADPKDPLRLRDFDLIWVSDLLDQLELKPVRRQVDCQSPFHVGAPGFTTTEVLRKGQKYYCPACRELFRRQKEENLRFIRTAARFDGGEANGDRQAGQISNIVHERGFGFIRNERGDYFFHFSEVVGDTEFHRLAVGDAVSFAVDIDPDPRNKERPAGKAAEVRRIPPRERPAGEAPDAGAAGPSADE